MEVKEILELEYHLDKVNIDIDTNYKFTKANDLVAIEGFDEILLKTLRGENFNISEWFKCCDTESYQLYLLVYKQRHAKICLVKYEKDISKSILGFKRLHGSELDIFDINMETELIHIVYNDPSGNTFKLKKEKAIINITSADEIYACGLFKKIKIAAIDYISYIVCPAYYSTGDKDCIGFCRNFLIQLQNMIGEKYTESQQKLLDNVQVVDTTLDRTIYPSKAANRIIKNNLYHFFRNIGDNLGLFVLIILAIWIGKNWL